MPEFLAKISKKNMLTADTVELILSTQENFSYKAGQFVQLVVPGLEKPVTRSYSLSSCPLDQNIALCVKLIPGGKASTYIANQNEGDAFTLKGPLGHFNIDEEANSHLFIATGSGIAPIISMIRDELERKNNTLPIRLIFGLRYEKDIILKSKLDELAKKYPNFEYKISLTRPESSWTGNCGRVTEYLSNFLPNEAYYICGNMEMVKDVREIILNSGVDAKKIRIEIF